MRKIRFILEIVLLFTAVSMLQAQDIRLTARVDRNPVGSDEQFTYEVTITGATQNLPDVQLPDLNAFAVLSGPNVSSSFQIVNFNMTASKSYSFVLVPKKIGNFTIGPATVKYKGKLYKSNSVTVNVVKQSAAPRASAPGRSGKSGGGQQVNLGDAVFLKVIPSKRRCYVNEQVLLRYKIYFRTNINKNEIIKLPEAVGCWVEEFPVPNRPRVYTETVNGKQYNVAEIKKVAVFPSRAGKITISPLDLMIETVIRRRRDPFDMFDDFFSDSFGKRVRKKISSGPVRLTVMPLPEKGRPADFNGLVGDFKLHSSVDKESCRANEAISYKVIINGRGLLKFLNKLPVQFPPDFEVYEPKVTQSINKTGGSITSSKEFEYVLIPRVAGEYRIKPLKLSYFNPADKRYHVLTAPPYNIRVMPGKKGIAAGAGSSIAAKEAVKLIGQDIHFIKTGTTAFQRLGDMPYRRWWFWGSPLLALLILGIAWGYRVHLDRMSRDVRYARSRKAHRQARARLRQAKALLKPGQAAGFYGEISRALIGYLADKTNRPAAGLMREDVVKLLTDRQVDHDLKTEFLKILDEADFRRFAPGEPTETEMREFYRRAETLLVKLAKYF